MAIEWQVCTLLQFQASVLILLNPFSIPASLLPPVEGGLGLQQRVQAGW